MTKVEPNEDTFAQFVHYLMAAVQMEGGELIIPKETLDHVESTPFDMTVKRSPSGDIILVAGPCQEHVS